MKRMVLDARKDFSMISLARDIVARVPDKDWPGEVRAIQIWVRNNIRYTRDPYDLETIQLPATTIQLGHGDCDDQAMVVAALLMSIGAPVRFVAIGLNPRQYCHVYTETQIGREWISVETTEMVDIGWHPPGVKKRVFVHL